MTHIKGPFRAQLNIRLRAVHASWTRWNARAAQEHLAGRKLSQRGAQPQREGPE